MRFPRVWRLSHLGAKLAFLRAGFGFGTLPLHLVEADLASGALVQIATEDAPPGGHVIAMWAVYRTDSPPGPAGRWFIDRLKQEEVPPLRQATSRSPPALNAPSAARRRSSKSVPPVKRKRSR
jgi:DNA-binding transcriptional LysR family regulator